MSNSANITVGVRGRYRAVVHTGHEFDELGNVVKWGKVLRETPFGKNVITLTGFSNILQGTATSGVMVCGAGNTTPTEADTTLDSYLGKTTSVASWETTKNATPDENGYITFQITARCTFPPSSLGGTSVNVAEAGFTFNVASGSVNGTTPVSSRGLIVDSEGDPVAIAVDNSFEYLDLIWEYTEYIPASVTGTVSIDVDDVPTNFDYEARPYNFDNNGGSFNSSPWVPGGSLSIPGWGPLGDSTYTWSRATNVFAGPLTGITGNGLGNGTRSNIPSQTSAAFSYGDKHRDMTSLWVPSIGNIVDGIGAFRVNVGHASFQIGVDPKIDKTDLKQLSMTWRYTMANI